MFNLRTNPVYLFGKLIERKIRRAVKIMMGIEILDPHDYQKWLLRYAGLNDSQREAMRLECENWSQAPLISIIMPVYNPNLLWLKEAIASVEKQIYPHWELCIADDCTTDGEVRSYLEQLTAEDHRIKVIFREKNGHISAASNSAIDIASGEWMAFLDQDDLLTEDALFYVARKILSSPECQLVYTDEDKIENGLRRDPYFKSDWNIELLRGQNMTCHLSAYRAERLRAIGGLRIGFEGAQDHDLVLRFSEGLHEAQIAHIPRVLYHWRAHSKSTSKGVGIKDYASQAGQKAVQEHVDRLNLDAKVEIIGPGRYRVHYAKPADQPKVTLIIPTRNGYKLLKQCIDSILNKTQYSNYEILIVDNNSDCVQTLNYMQLLEANPKISVIRYAGVFNYSAINNHAVAQASGDYVALVNNDIEVISPNWLDELMSLAVQRDVGAVGVRLLYPNRTMQHAGVVLGIRGVAGHIHRGFKGRSSGYFGRAGLAQSLSVVTAACLVVRKSTFDQVGGLNEKDLPVAFNDVDLCLKIRELGLRNIWTPYVELYHHESATRGKEDSPEKKERARKEVAYMLERWGDALVTDPAYNPNLTLEYEDFCYAWPPRTSSDPTLAS